MLILQRAIRVARSTETADTQSGRFGEMLDIALNSFPLLFQSRAQKSQELCA